MDAGPRFRRKIRSLVPHREVIGKQMTARERKKRDAKRLRAKYRTLHSDARRGTPGAAEKRDALDDRLKLLGVRLNPQE